MAAVLRFDPRGPMSWRIGAADCPRPTSTWRCLAARRAGAAPARPPHGQRAMGRPGAVFGRTGCSHGRLPELRLVLLSRGRQTKLVREAMQLSSVLLRQLAVIVYGVLYFLLASSMEAENVQQGYPLAYVLPSMLAQTFVVCGIFLFALNTSNEFARIWQWLFPLLIAELAAGMVVDVTHAADALGIIPDELFSVWFVAPAYYFNFKVARYRS